MEWQIFHGVHNIVYIFIFISRSKNKRFNIKKQEIKAAKCKKNKFLSAARWIKINQKRDQKSTKNRPKMDQKSIKNRPQIAQADGVPRFWSRAQVVLDFGALLGSSWRRHGSVLGGKSGQHGSNLAPSWLPKRRQNPSWAVPEASWELLGGCM